MNSLLSVRFAYGITQVVCAAIFTVGIGQCSSLLEMDGQINTSSGAIRFVPDNSTATPFSISGTGSVGAVTGASYAYAQYTSTAGYGQMGVSFNAQAACTGSGCGQQSVTGFLQIGSFDVLHVSNAPPTGLIQFSYSLSGGGLLQSAASGSGFTVDDELWTSLVIRDSCSSSACQASTYVPFGTGQTSITLPTTGTITMPYSNSTLSFYFVFEGAFSCNADVSGPCQLSFNLAPATLSNARVLDTSRNPIAGALLSSDSGFNYTSVPEPGSVSFVLFGIASGALLRFNSRKRS